MVSLLDLPKSLRETIYRHCYLVRPCPIDLGRERERARLFENHGFNRQMRRGCSYLRRLYAKDGDDLRFPLDCLHPLLPLSLFSVCRQIHDEAFAIFYGENHFAIRQRDPAGLKPLQALTPQARRCIRSLHVSLNAGVKTKYPRGRDWKEWAEICRLLASDITPGQVRFSLVYEVPDAVLARPVLEPLKELPPLADCAISLHRTPDVALAELAKAAAEQAMGGSSAASQRPFPFQKLPVELQRQVLSATDLVVRWDPTQLTTEGIAVTDGHLYIERQCCMRCTDAGEDCCCPLRRAAFARHCACYQVPTALFRINHAIGREARYIFYSSNRFTFDGDMRETLTWFQRLPEDALKALRRIDFSFETRQLVIEWEKEREEPWRELIEFIGEHLELSKLWLSIDAGHDGDEGWDQEYDLPEYYERMIDPLRTLKGLAKFHVFLVYPESDYETIAEKAVMGSDYDSAADGKISYQTRNELYPHRPPGPMMRIPYYE
ncbi:MAG: hypothetical protein M1823_003789 [Watsoniomyces obsoletus]|nr:MAG: hypothetical protein M1823_003789 [Watsoniomyces obsoletus]